MRILLVVNETAGGNNSGVFDMVRRIGVADNEVVVRYVTRSAPLSSRLADAESFDRVIISGGDGTVSSACYALRDSSVPILIYPAGTANLLASNLGLPVEAAELAELAIKGPIAKFDLGEIEATAADGELACAGFILVAGAGYDAQIMKGAGPLKASLGAAAYLAAALINPAPTVADLSLEIDDATIETRGFAVFVTNFARIQFDLPLTPGADPADGRFEVAVAVGRSVAGLIPAVAAAVLDRGGDFPDRGPGVTVYSGTRMRVAADPPLPVQWDGETTGATTPFAVRILPKATTLIVPFDSRYAAADGV